MDTLQQRQEVGRDGPAPTYPGRWLFATALAAYMVVLAMVLLNPSADLPTAVVEAVHRRLVDHGLTGGILTASRIEFLLNVAILMPVSALGLLVWRGTNWRDWTAYAFAISGAVELSQGLFLPDRSATFADVVANGLGGLVGAVIVSSLLGLLSPARY